MFGDHFVGDSQSQSSASIFGGKKRVEYIFQPFGVDALALIFKGHHQLPCLSVCFGCFAIIGSVYGGDLQLTAIRHGLDGILNQVMKCLYQLVGIYLNLRQIFRKIE